MQPRTSSQRIGLLLLLLGLAVGAASGWFAGRHSASSQRTLRADPELRAQALRELVDQGAGIWDTSPDPDVGRLLQPGLVERSYAGTTVNSNALGMREREVELPKPAGRVRVVLLGDSYVFGDKAATEERVGVFLERYLGERSARDGIEIECLHFGLSSWNLRSECEWLRRQLDLLQPDLVVHITVSNDLDDVAAARGFGAMSRSGPQRPAQHGVRVTGRVGIELGFERHGFLRWGLDHLSRERFALEAQRVARLAREVERGGGRYVLLVNWDAFNRVASEQLTHALREDQLAWIPPEFWMDRDNWVTPTDAHWGATGAERVARMLFALTVEREWLPALALEPWEEALRAREEIHARGAQDAAQPFPLAEALVGNPLLPSIDLDELDDQAAAQIHAGIDQQGRVGPYAAVILACRGGSALLLRGRALERSELAGARVRVLVEGEELHEILLEPGAPIDVSLELSTHIGERDFISLEFVASDWVYDGHDLQAQVVMDLETIQVIR